MIDERYADPRYRGPELAGLSERASFDLAKQYRIALAHKRVAERMAFERSRSFTMWAFWGTVAGVLFIAGGLTLAMCTVHLWY